jgi:hypothetical protein
MHHSKQKVFDSLLKTQADLARHIIFIVTHDVLVQLVIEAIGNKDYAHTHQHKYITEVDHLHLDQLLKKEEGEHIPPICYLVECELLYVPVKK